MSRIVLWSFILIISYSAAAMLSSHVSMDLSQTNWTSLWTYFWWVVSLPIIGVVSFGVFGLIINWWVNL